MIRGSRAVEESESRPISRPRRAEERPANYPLRKGVSTPKPQPRRESVTTLHFDCLLPASSSSTSLRVLDTPPQGGTQTPAFWLLSLYIAGTNLAFLLSGTS